MLVRSPNIFQEKKNSKHNMAKANKPWRQSSEKRKTCGTIYPNTIYDLIQLPLVFQAPQIDHCTQPDELYRNKG